MWVLMLAIYLRYIFSLLRTYLAATYDALVLVVSKRAFVAYSNESGWSDVTIADRTLSVTFVAKTSYGNAWLLSTHY